MPYASTRRANTPEQTVWFCVYKSTKTKCAIINSMAVQCAEVILKSLNMDLSCEAEKLMLSQFAEHEDVTKTCLYNFDPLKPHFYIVKLGCKGVYIIVLISAQKHSLWVHVRTASSRRF